MRQSGVTRQTTSQRFVLVDTTDKPRAELRAADNFDLLIHHEIKELGVCGKQPCAA